MAFLLTKGRNKQGTHACGMQIKQLLTSPDDVAEEILADIIDGRLWQYERCLEFNTFEDVYSRMTMIRHPKMVCKRQEVSVDIEESKMRFLEIHSLIMFPCWPYCLSHHLSGDT